MLTLKSVRKEYKTGNLVQKALDGVSISFRDCEFTAILGPSGSGKTTLLNVIGGLDSYDSGEMTIRGIPTSHYGSRDWDTYRNHTIGFIFQSYNLIPHQTILSNVELGMTLAGVGKEERRKRAQEALQRVGLLEQAQKKPNQLSGGQMQRVAIARALACEPSVLLADEPTGALDSDTGEQVMHLLKEVAKDHLVIMVTHNPDLADRYATRIVRLRDGKVLSDTDPYDPESPTAAADRGMAEAAAAEIGKAEAASADAGKTEAEAAAAESGKAEAAATERGKAETAATESGKAEAAAADGGKAETAVTESGKAEAAAADGGKAEKTAAESRKAETEDARAETGKTGGEETSAAAGKAENTASGLLRRRRKPSMSFLTALSLSVANLLSKKARTILVAFAASIGIVGIALILSLSNGANAYIRQMERDSLSQYPIEIATSAFSMEETMMTFAQMRQSMGEVSQDQVTEQQMMGGMLASAKVNDLASLKRWFESGYSGMEEYTRGIDYSYGISPQIYQIRGDSYAQVNPDQTMSAFGLSMDDSLTGAFSGYSLNEVFLPLPGNEALYQDDYTLLAGSWPKKDTDLVLVLTGSQGVPDFLLYTMGLKDVNELNSQIEGVVAGKGTDGELEESRVYDPEDFLGISFRLLPAYDLYQYDEKLDLWLDASGNENRMMELLEGAEEMQIVGVVRPAEGVSFGILGIGIEYPGALLERLMKQAAESAIVQDQMYFPDTDVLTNIPFGETDDSSLASMLSMIEIHPEFLEDAVTLRWDKLDRLETEDTRLSVRRLVRILREYSRSGESETLRNMMESLMPLLGELIEIDEERIGDVISFSMDETQMQEMFAARATARSATYEGNLTKFGYADPQAPSRVTIYPSDFDSKNEVVRLLDAYNAAMEEEGYEEKVISYTDYVGSLMTSVTTIIDVITYVLIAFVAVSLVVSSIMIGIITYISVLERRKEIGILRAMGASRHNITEVFNAETFIIGVLAGIFGIALTLILQVPINHIIRTLADQEGVRAFLPPGAGMILVLLCILLTFIGGFIPSRKAARQDPVEALRSE